MTADPAAGLIPDELKTAIDAEVEGCLRDLVKIRHHLHKNPELSWKEHETMAYLSRQLGELGLEHRSGVAGTGIILDLGGDKPGPTTAYRADMDAIGLQDAKAVDYASSRPGVMHACGHDFHMTVGLGVARVVDRLREWLPGRLRILFQPAEEVVPAGSAAMIEDGALDEVSAIYAMHVEPGLPLGHVGLRYGAVTASADMFDLMIKGRSGHSSRPYLAIDAILIATKVVEAMYQVVSQRTDPLESAVLNVGTIEGGDAANVICGHVRMTGAVRCFDRGLRKKLPAWLDEVAGGIVRGMGGEHELVVRQGAPPLFNDDTLMNRVRRAAEDVVGPHAIHLVERPSMGGEDFSWYAERAPAALLRIGTSAPGFEAQLHNHNFDAGDKPLGPALRIVLRTLFAQNYCAGT